MKGRLLIKVHAFCFIRITSIRISGWDFGFKTIGLLKWVTTYKCRSSDRETEEPIQSVRIRPTYLDFYVVSWLIFLEWALHFCWTSCDITSLQSNHLKKSVHLYQKSRKSLKKTTNLIISINPKIFRYRTLF